MHQIMPRMPAQPVAAEMLEVSAFSYIYYYHDWLLVLCACVRALCACESFRSGLGSTMQATQIAKHISMFVQQARAFHLEGKMGDHLSS